MPTKLNWNDACRMRDDGLEVPINLRPKNWKITSLPKHIRMRDKLPTIAECKAYMDRCNYDCVGVWHKGRFGKRAYVFRDRTGSRPLHIREMTWPLTELRHAYNNGW